MNAHERPLRSAKGRGFTLIELLVALSAGVLVSAAAFMLSRNATAFFQREARISSAQLALTLAMNRITNDIQRASQLSTPNIQADPTVCRQSTFTGATGLAKLAGIYIGHGTATAQGSLQSTPPSPTSTSYEPATPPDQIVIGGSLDSTEVYQVQKIQDMGSGNGPLIVMQSPSNDPATNRMTKLAGSALMLPCKLAPVFHPTDYPYTGPIPSGASCSATSMGSERIARLYHPDSNTQWYGVIKTASINPASGEIDVQLEKLPALPLRSLYACGLNLDDTGQGWLFSVITRVRYDIRSLQTGAYSATQYISPACGPTSGVAAAYQGAVTGDSGRTELIRTEIDSNDTELTSTTELVAEYAVDLRFGITVSSKVTEFSYDPTVTSYAFGDGNVYSVAGDVSLSATATPQLLRAVQIRLSTRTRAPDRDSDLAAGPDGRRLRWQVNSTPAAAFASLQPLYARVRTIYSNVMLPNQGGFSKW